jgi:hypothetical protein
MSGVLAALAVGVLLVGTILIGVRIALLGRCYGGPGARSMGVVGAAVVLAATVVAVVGWSA